MIVLCRRLTVHKRLSCRDRRCNVDGERSGSDCKRINVVECRAECECQRLQVGVAVENLLLIRRRIVVQMLVDGAASLMGDLPDQAAMDEYVGAVGEDKGLPSIRKRGRLLLLQSVDLEVGDEPDRIERAATTMRVSYEKVHIPYAGWRRT